MKLKSALCFAVDNAGCLGQTHKAKGSACTSPPQEFHIFFIFFHYCKDQSIYQCMPLSLHMEFSLEILKY